MDKFLLNGPCKVEGRINISGSKNAALPILAATLLFDKPVELKNLPNVRDIQTMLALLKSLGSKIKISKKQKAIEDEQKELEAAKADDQPKAAKKNCGCC